MESRSEARGESQTNGRQGRIGMVKLVKEATYSLIDKRYIDTVGTLCFKTDRRGIIQGNAEAILEFEKPTNVSYVEVYPACTMHCVQFYQQKIRL
jgi:hypothetical protein